MTRNAGRPIKYKTEEERVVARREAGRLRNQRYRRRDQEKKLTEQAEWRRLNNLLDDSVTFEPN